AERIAAGLARSAASRILDLLSDVAAELSAELPEGRVEIHLVGDDVELAYVDEGPTTEESDAELSARITLRLPDQLKARVEESAAREGVSVNGWVLRALERGTSTSKARSGRAGSRPGGDLRPSRQRRPRHARGGHAGRRRSGGQGHRGVSALGWPRHRVRQDP